MFFVILHEAHWMQQADSESEDLTQDVESYRLYQNFIKNYLKMDGIKTASLGDKQWPVDYFLDEITHIVLNHAKGLHDYLLSELKASDENSFNQLNNNESIYFFYIVESLVYAKSKQLSQRQGNNHTEQESGLVLTDNHLILDSLIMIDSNHLAESFMQSIAPQVGTPFHINMIKKAEEVITQQVDNENQKLAKLDIIGLLDSFKLDKMNPSQRNLFFAKNTGAQVVNIILNDIHKAQASAIALWTGDKSTHQTQAQDKSFTNRVFDSFLRIYSSSMRAEFSAMKKEFGGMKEKFASMTDDEKNKYLASFDSPDGKLIERTREAVDRIMQEAIKADDHQNTHHDMPNQ